MMPEIKVLNVLLHGKAIGTLTLLPGERTLFAFNDGYIENPDRPTFSLSFKDQFGGLIAEHAPTRTRLTPFFSNLLPEGPLRDYLAGRAGVKEQREFFLLWVLGQDLPGAITIVPANGQRWPQDSSEPESPNQPEMKATALRFSLAGVQLKFSAAMGARGGLTIPAKGVGGSWIIKLPSASFGGVPENEFSMMTLAGLVGMDMPEVRLVETAQIKGLPEGMGRINAPALAVKRFDRTDNGNAVHIEDFAQVFGVYPERKYERASYRNIAEVLWAETGTPGVTEFVRRLVFNVLIGNADMHLKNWSLIYPDKRSPALSPGYDFVSTIAFMDDATLALNLVKSKGMAAVSRETLVHFAAKARLSEQLVIRTANETVEKFMAIWALEKTHLPLTTAMVKAIDTHLPKIELVRENRQA
jgi:serine/threonine-protein kinase HipA